uniref:Uncharacterized protein n=1 Tax=Physcomitrium patens TaxID=3218 RepID=A0A2K1K2S3_PHYPA|nr:hypothetical protein PHYPA_012551 [Physcomitrium patens]
MLEGISMISVLPPSISLGSEVAARMRVTVSTSMELFRLCMKALILVPRAWFLLVAIETGGVMLAIF